uniref:Protein kinase domain-containing protein n=1 Tax=Macrostomum lignano TaxID=282301 RepID=A0A1I8FBH1_9PLAT
LRDCSSTFCSTLRQRKQRAAKSNDGVDQNAGVRFSDRRLRRPTFSGNVALAAENSPMPGVHVMSTVEILLAVTVLTTRTHDCHHASRARAHRTAHILVGEENFKVTNCRPAPVHLVSVSGNTKELGSARAIQILSRHLWEIICLLPTNTKLVDGGLRPDGRRSLVATGLYLLPSWATAYAVVWLGQVVRPTSAVSPFISRVPALNSDRNARPESAQSKFRQKFSCNMGGLKLANSTLLLGKKLKLGISDKQDSQPIGCVEFWTFLLEVECALVSWYSGFNYVNYISEDGVPSVSACVIYQFVVDADNSSPSADNPTNSSGRCQSPTRNAESAAAGSASASAANGTLAKVARLAGAQSCAETSRERPSRSDPAVSLHVSVVVGIVSCREEIEPVLTASDSPAGSSALQATVLRDCLDGQTRREVVSQDCPVLCSLAKHSWTAAMKPAAEARVIFGAGSAAAARARECHERHRCGQAFPIVTAESSSISSQRLYTRANRRALNPRGLSAVYSMNRQSLNTGEQKDMTEFFNDLIAKLEEMTRRVEKV